MTPIEELDAVMRGVEMSAREAHRIVRSIRPRAACRDMPPAVFFPPRSLRAPHVPSTPSASPPRSLSDTTSTASAPAPPHTTAESWPADGEQSPASPPSAGARRENRSPKFAWRGSREERPSDTPSATFCAARIYGPDGEPSTNNEVRQRGIRPILG